MSVRLGLAGLLITIGLFGLVATDRLAAPAAEAAGTWSVPRQIPDYHNPLTAPLLVADQAGAIYAFNYETNATNSGVLVFRRWSLAQDWSAPVDFLVLGVRAGPQSVQGVFLDQAGRFHLIYYSGTEQVGALYYSWAYAVNAHQASAWSEPVAIARQAGPVAAAALTGDGQGRLVAVYGGQALGVGLYEVRSADGGRTWTAPAVISLVTAPDRWPSAVWLTPDEGGRVHAVWHINNLAGVGEEIWYARLEPATERWADLARLAGRQSDLDLLGWGSLVEAGDSLIVAYQQGYPPTRWVRQSPDGGRTWTDPVRPFPHIGGYEYIVLTRDSNDVVHMVLGNRLPNPETHGMWHSQLVDNLWTPLEPISAGPSTATFDPCCPRAVISQGNLLFATWAHNVRREHLTGAWYAYKVLDAPRLPEVPLPVPPAAEPEPTAPAVPSPTPSQPAGGVEVAPPAGSPEDQPAAAPVTTEREASPAVPILVGTLPVIAVIGLVVLVRRFWRRGA